MMRGKIIELKSKCMPSRHFDIDLYIFGLRNRIKFQLRIRATNDSFTLTQRMSFILPTQ